MGTTQARAVCSRITPLADAASRNSSANVTVLSLVASLQKCSRSKDLKTGKEIHSQAIASSLIPSNIFLANTLINMYSKCGSIADAQNVFNAMPERDLVSWNSFIQGCVSNGRSELACDLFDRMQVAPDGRTYVAAISACASLAAKTRSGLCREMWLQRAERIHSQAVENRCCDGYLESRFLSMYSKCGFIHKARAVFDRMSSSIRDRVCWNVLLQGYVENGESELALQLFQRMEEEEGSADARSFLAAITACLDLEMKRKDGRWLAEGRFLHSKAISRRCCDVFVRCKLIELYASCGCMADSRAVFDAMNLQQQRNVVAWNCLIQGYADNGDCSSALKIFYEMEGYCVQNERSYVAALAACAALAEDGNVLRCLQTGKDLHSRAAMNKCCNIYVNNLLISLYGRCRSVIDSKAVFDKMAERDVVSWTALLQAYVRNEHSELALEQYDAGFSAGFATDPVFFMTALTACVSLAAAAPAASAGKDSTPEEFIKSLLAKGQEIHSQAVSCGCCDIFVENTLIDLLAKCGSMVDARKIFDKMVKRDVVSWTVLLQGYVENGQSLIAMELFDLMEEQEQGCAADGRTYVAALTACVTLAFNAKRESKVMNSSNVWLCKGRRILSRALSRGCCDVFVWNCWIRGCVDCGESEMALDLAREMQVAEVCRDTGTYVAVLMACGSLMALDRGKVFHAEILRRGLEEDLLVGTCLVELYGKCGALQVAELLFDSVVAIKDIGAWNALLCGYSNQGDAERCFEIFQSLQREAGLSPSDRTFTHLLAACSRAGLSDKGKKTFAELISNRSFSPTLVHYTCLVDLLSRGNRVDEAVKVMNEMPHKADAATWTALLAACRMWKNDAVGVMAYESLLKLNKSDAAAYNLMANIYSTDNRS